MWPRLWASNMKAQDMTGAKKEAGESAENPLLSLGLNILIPVIILMRFSAEDRLGPVYGLLVALAFPVTYGLYDFTRRRNFNLFSALGFVGILLTGVVGLLKLDVQWIAIKEAGIPLILGIVVVGSLKTRFPLVRKLLGKMIKLDRVDAALREKGTAEVFERQLVRATYIVGASFFLSALGRDGAADGRTAPAGLRHPPLRTGRATFTASGSPSDGLDWCVGNIGFSAILVGFIHPASSVVRFVPLPSDCPPSPCGRLSRPRTTTRALPHVRRWPKAGLLRCRRAGRASQVRPGCIFMPS